MLRGAALLEQIEATHTTTPTLWWLGHCGFAVKYASLLFYLDPCLSTPPGMRRISEPPLAPPAIDNADLILCSHAHAPHFDGATLLPMLDASPRAKVVLPKCLTEHARSLGIGYDRMTPTDSGLRVEYFKDCLHGRVYAVPSAHPNLDWTPAGGYPYLGYLIRFEGVTIYYAGDTVYYEDLALRLKPFQVSVAILPIGSGLLDIPDAAQLAEDIGAEWLIPMHYGTFAAEDDTAASPKIDRFVEHMLGQRPLQKFKTFLPGESWTVPAAPASADTTPTPTIPFD